MATPTITPIALAAITPSSFNPRKSFDKDSLADLTESIRTNGVLSPICVRPTSPNGSSYEIIYGERRYRAAIDAGLSTIPAIITDVDDIDAKEIAVIENLQRENVSPIEEAAAYLQLVKDEKYNIKSLATQFGKSENYISSRLKLNDLIPDIATLLANKEISLVLALEISKLNKETQEKILRTRLSGSNLNNWKNLKPTDIITEITRQLSDDLDDFDFDKTDCKDCPDNTINALLFKADNDDCGNCTSSQCLAKKLVAHSLNKVKDLIKKYPTAKLTEERHWGIAKQRRDTIVDKLKNEGYDITEDGYYNEFYKVPNENEDERYEDYKDTLATKRVIHRIYIDNNGVRLEYKVANTKEKANVVSTPTAEIATLKEKDNRNRVLSDEKIINETASLIRTEPTPSVPISSREEELLFYVLLNELNPKDKEIMGLKEALYLLSNDDKKQLVANLTPEQKAIIIRNFLSNRLINGFATNEMVKEFAQMHFPDQQKEIETRNNDIYEKRHTRLLERIDDIENPKPVEDKNKNAA